MSKATDEGMLVAASFICFSMETLTGFLSGFLCWVIIYASTEFRKGASDE